MNPEPLDYSAYSGLASDRRSTSRFPVHQEVRYRLLHSKMADISGTGASLDMSSGGILFTTEQRLPLGRLVEIAVNWPARLGGTCPLKFVAVGRVVRSEPAKAAVRIDRYEFRTRRAEPDAPRVQAASQSAI